MGNVFVYKGKVKGVINKGDKVLVVIDNSNCEVVKKNYSVIYFLYVVLREILGEYVM